VQIRIVLILNKNPIKIKNLGLIDQQIFGAIYGDIRTGRRVGGMWSSVGKAAKEAPKSVRGKDMEDVLKISENVIAAAVRRMRSGDFAAEPYNGKCPDYCPARDICRIKDNQTHEMMSAEEDANG
jgi:ATP-dependent helicase/nuclease subunit B